MNTKLAILLVSVLLNGILATAIFLSPKKEVSSSGEKVRTTSARTATAVASTNAAAGAPFRWGRVASDDLKLYRNNLLAIGCPETTTREIIRAVINEKSRRLRREILEAFQPHFWELVLGGQLTARQVMAQNEWGKKLDALAADRQTQIADVLGVEFTDSQLAEHAQAEEREQQRAWLSPEKRARLSALEEKHQRDLARWSARSGSREMTDDDQQQLQKIEKAFTDGKNALLSPDEQKELHLRESEAAGWASGLPGFAPSEDEWHTLTALRAEFEKSRNDLDSSQLPEDEMAARQSELQSNLDAAEKAALGDQRFAELQQANNDDYQAFHNVTQRYGLPDSIAADSLKAQETARQAARQILADPNLSPDARQAALSAIQKETENTLSQIMGPNVFSTYKEYGGDWLDSFATETSR